MTARDEPGDLAAAVDAAVDERTAELHAQIDKAFDEHLAGIDAGIDGDRPGLRDHLTAARELAHKLTDEVALMRRPEAGR